MFSHLVIVDRVVSDVHCKRPLLSQSIGSLLSWVDLPLRAKFDKSMEDESTEMFPCNPAETY